MLSKKNLDFVKLIGALFGGAVLAFVLLRSKNNSATAGSFGAAFTSDLKSLFTTK